MPTLEQAACWYPETDPTHGFDHVLRVLALAERLAEEEGGDVEIVRAAALLHDAVPPVGGGEAGSNDEAPPAAAELRAAHHLASAEFAAQVLRREGWSAERIAAVQHCIRAHRYRDRSEPPASLEARILFDADKLDAIGAIGAARAIGYAFSHHQPAYASPSAQFVESGQIQAGEPYSAYHEYLFKLRRIKDSLLTPAGRRLGETRHAHMTAFFEALAHEAQAGQP